MAEQEREPLTNVGALNDAIINAFREVRAIDIDINELTETHIKPLKDERVRLLRELKADTTIDGSDVRLFFQIWSRQEDARTILEEADRDRVLDNLRTLFVALSQGEMLDFVDLLQDGAHKPAHIKAGEEQREEVVEEEAEEAAAVPPPAEDKMAVQVKRGAASS
jgi:hypothetical protein